MDQIAEKAYLNYPVNKTMIRRGRMNFLAADLSGHPQICRLLKADRCTWKDFQAEQQLQRAAKKRYLQYHSLRCAQETRQLLSLQARRPAR